MPSSHHRDSVSKAEVLPSSRSISPAPVSRQSPASQADLSLNSKDEVGGRLHAGPAAQQTKVVVRRSGGIGDGFLALAEPELLGADARKRSCRGDRLPTEACQCERHALCGIGRSMFRRRGTLHRRIGRGRCLGRGTLGQGTKGALWEISWCL